MALDRDLSLAVVQALFPGNPRASGWETTAATGVRGLRLVHESGRFASFRLSESSDRAFPVLEENARRYPGAEAVHEDARRFGPPAASTDYVDLDPYGSPLPYLDRAISAVRPGGVLAVTATDMAVLAGAQRSATRRRYEAEPVRGRLGPEGAVRLLVALVVRRAATRGVGTECLLAYVGEHHVRAFLQLGPGPEPAAPVGSIDTGTFDGPPIVSDRPVGPLWLGPLVGPTVARRLAVPSTAAEPTALGRLLERLREESEVGRPFFFEPNEIAGRLSLAEPPSLAALLAALRSAGYRATRTHVRPEGFRTDAPRSVVDECARSLGAGG